MKGLQRSYIRPNDSAQIGIGTLIIFIAMVLVAAVAGAVLIQTSGVLQQKAQSTGNQATQETSSNLQIREIEGIRSKSSATNLSSTIDLLRINIGLNAGSEPVDLGQVIITISDGDTTNELVYANEEKPGVGTMGSYYTNSSLTSNLRALTLRGTPTANIPHFFIAEKVRDEDGSFTQQNPTINTGDLINIYVGTVSSDATSFDYLYLVDTTGGAGGAAPLKDSGLTISPRTELRVILTPEYGAVATADMVMPSTYGSIENVKLYP